MGSHPEHLPVTPEQLAAPPRRLSPIAAQAALLGGFVCQLGWAFCLIGMILFWLCAYDIFAAEARFRGPSSQGEAVIESSSRIEARINRVWVIANRYHFVHQGREYQGVAYATGKRLNPGESAPVEFLSGNPEVSRLLLPDFRPAAFERWMLAYVFVFLIPGLGLMLFGSWRGFGQLRLLRAGVPVMGKLARKRPTGRNTRIDGMLHPHHELVYRYQAGGQDYETGFKTYDPALVAPEPGSEAPLLYLPAQPSRALPVAAIPGRLDVDAQGGFSAGKDQLIWLVVPGATLIVTLLMLLVKA